jgi:hypothetical protein
MNKRADKKSAERKTPITVNIFSNNRISLDGKSVLFIILAAAIAIVTALVVSGSGTETQSSLIRSLIDALLGS